MPFIYDVIALLDQLRTRQVPWVPHPAILGFLATTSTHDTHPSATVARVEELSPGEAPNEVLVRLRGKLPRLLLPGENLTVSISRYERFSGYQIKTGNLESFEKSGDHFRETPGHIVLHGRRTYTTHHSPYDLQFYERVPVDEVLNTVGEVDHGVLALGVNANISPRLLFHHEEKHGLLNTYHGDGMAMKTFQNLSVNTCAVLLAFDFSSLRGYALVGRCEEVSRQENPQATEQIDKGFKVLGFGRPNRIFRHQAERIEELSADPLGPGTSGLAAG